MTSAGASLLANPLTVKSSDIRLFRAALAAALVAVTYLTTAEISPQVAGGVNDKLSHLLAFYALTLLADFSFPAHGLNVRKILSLFAYGVVIECIQGQLPYREFSLADMAANGLGIFAYWLSIPLLRHLPKLKTRWTQRPEP